MLPFEPVAELARWVSEAGKTGLREPSAMVVSTVDAAGRPSSRVVLMRGLDERGLVFFTNRESQKGRECAATGVACACFYFDALARQVRVEGTIAPVADAESDAYWATRPRESQIGAWASLQSQPLPSRETLLARFAEYESRFSGGPVPRPPHWGGLRLVPRRFEFWQGVSARLHDRDDFERDEARPGGWAHRKLYP